MYAEFETPRGKKVIIKEEMVVGIVESDTGAFVFVQSDEKPFTLKETPEEVWRRFRYLREQEEAQEKEDESMQELSDSVVLDMREDNIAKKERELCQREREIAKKEENLRDNTGTIREIVLEEIRKGDGQEEAEGDITFETWIKRKFGVTLGALKKYYTKSYGESRWKDYESLLMGHFYIADSIPKQPYERVEKGERKAIRNMNE